jgi:5-methylcytosine-specific restriction endonuclease McrA
MPTSSINGPRSLGRTGTKYLTARKQVLENNQICALCGELIDLELAWPNPMYGTVDHIIPVADLARDDPALWDPKNLQPAHLACNARKGRGDRQVAVHPTSRNWRE